MDVKLTCLLAGVLVSGCVTSAGKKGAAGGGSVATAINFQMPSLAPLQLKVPNIATLMNGYVLSIQPTVPGCAGSTVNKIGVYGQSTIFGDSLIQGCDYAIVIAYGNMASPTATSLSKVYYRNNAPVIVTKESIQGQPSIAVHVSLQTQPDGLAIGLADALSSSPPHVQTPPTNTTVTQPVVTQPQTSVSTAMFPQDVDIGLSGGASGSTTLSRLFHGKYLIVEVSDGTCSYCVKLARSINQNTAMQKLIDSANCSYAVVTSDRNDWVSAIGRGWVADHSYLGDYQKMYRALTGSVITGIPEVFALDSQGKLVEELNQDVEGFASNRCR